jgi:hypothetical protein
MLQNNFAILEAAELRSILISVVQEQLEEFKKALFVQKLVGSKSDEYLTRKEAAEFLKISETTLWSLDKNQILPAKRLNGKVLYLRSQLLNFHEDQA